MLRRVASASRHMLLKYKTSIYLYLWVHDHWRKDRQIRMMVTKTVYWTHVGSCTESRQEIEELAKKNTTYSKVYNSYPASARAIWIDVTHLCPDTTFSIHNVLHSPFWLSILWVYWFRSGTTCNGIQGTGAAMASWMLILCLCTYVERAPGHHVWTEP